MTQSGRTISSTRHWSRQGEGGISPDLLTMEEATLAMHFFKACNEETETVPDIYSSLFLARHDVWEPGDWCNHHSRYDQPQPHTPGPGTWKQIGWNFQIISTFLPVGPLLPHTLHGSSLLHTRELHANSKTPHTTSIREGVNRLPCQQQQTSQQRLSTFLSTTILVSKFLSPNFLCSGIVRADVSSDKLSMKLHHLFRTILHLFEQTVQQLDTRSFFFTSKAKELRWKMT